jgi:hypothetical protein
VPVNPQMQAERPDELIQPGEFARAAVSWKQGASPN